MNRVRKFTPENRLARFFTDPNGLLYAHALQRATANLSAAKPSLLAALDVKLETLTSLAMGEQALANEPMIYRLAEDLISDAGAVGLNELSQAAHSLCDLLVSEGRGPKFAAALQVHVSALVVLRQPATPASRAHRDAILGGLSRLSRKCDP